MDPIFDRCFDELIGIEGRYSNHPDDSGGETMFGITRAVARAYGYDGEMRQMPLHVAKSIYHARYWQLLRLDEVAELSPAIARELFDTGVNRGQSVAGRYIQQALNAFNDKQSLYPDLVVDGLLGQMTLYALREYFRKRSPDPETVMLRALNAQQGADYLDLALSREKDESFVYGWFRNRVS